METNLKNIIHRLDGPWLEQLVAWLLQFANLKVYVRTYYTVTRQSYLWMSTNTTELAQRRTKQNSIDFPARHSGDTTSIQAKLLQCCLKSLIVYLQTHSWIKAKQSDNIGATDMFFDTPQGNANKISRLLRNCQFVLNISLECPDLLS